jgi:HrpA-like RNA helicase
MSTKQVENTENSPTAYSQDPIHIHDFQRSLPIFKYKREVIESILNHDVVVITGDTGSGKSTQLPQYIYDSANIRNRIYESQRRFEASEKSEKPGKINVGVVGQEVKLERKASGASRGEKKESKAQEKVESEEVSEPLFEIGMDASPDERVRIVVTQPRRVAAISMTKRICFERGLPELGGEISYAIRFDDKTTEKTKMRYVTDGILVRECISVS